MENQLVLQVEDRGPVAVPVANAVVAGWTARDRAAVEHHIAELAEIGVKRPSAIPLFYRISPALLTAERAIQVVGTESSGEVEPVLIGDGADMFLGLGSDHTDRALEAHSVALSKQVCAKPVAPAAWSYGQVRDHLDRIELRSWVRDDGEAEWTLYQDGTLAKIRPLPELAELSPLALGPDRLQPGTVMMCGTFGVVSGGVRASRHFRMQMHDPVLGRTVEHAYETLFLPLVD